MLTLLQYTHVMWWAIFKDKC